MNPASPEPVIRCVDKLVDGLVLRFGDGRSVFYSADLLYRMIPHAQILVDDENESFKP